MTSQQLLERVVELAAECRDDGMGGGEFVSTVAYGLGHVSQLSAPNKDAAPSTGGVPFNSTPLFTVASRVL